MNRWLGRLWFAPNGLAEYAKKGRKMDGIYVPYWTYDADTRTRYTGQRGTAYYVTVRGKDGKPQRVRKMRWTRVSGRVARFFDDVVILASRSLPKRFTDALQPWGLEALTEYRPDYLSGFRAEGYTVDLDEGMEEARGIMDARIRHDIARDIGGDAQRIGVVDTRLSDVTFKHILLPVWLAAYRYNGKPYRFVVNGQTGKVQGERPYSAIKIAIAVILAIIIGAAVLYGLQLADEGGAEFGMARGPDPRNQVSGASARADLHLARALGRLIGLLGHADGQHPVLQPRMDRLGIRVRRQAEGPRERPVGAFGEEIAFALFLPFEVFSPETLTTPSCTVMSISPRPRPEAPARCGIPRRSPPPRTPARTSRRRARTWTSAGPSGTGRDRICGLIRPWRPPLSWQQVDGGNFHAADRLRP
jgi:hypothetical protein